MQKVNTINLKRGLNSIVIDHTTIGLESSKRPLALLPLGTAVKSVYFDTAQLFRSSSVGNQENAESCIKTLFMLGTNEDTQSLLTWSEDPANTLGHSEANTGNDFSINKYNETELILETWISPRVWTMESDMLQLCRYNGCFGTQLAAVSGAGYNGVSYQYCEEWNGSSWSVTGSINTADMRGPASCGIESAGLMWGGYTANTPCEEYDGSSWSVTGSINTGKRYPAGMGTQTAAVTAGGYDGATRTLVAEEYNGSTWTTVNSIATGRMSPMGSGTQTSALLYGGGPDTWVAEGYVDSYNGSVWTTEDTMPLAIQSFGGCGGSSTDALAMTGHQNYQHELIYNSQEYDGTWTVVNSVNISANTNGCGSKHQALMWGGNIPTNLSTNRTESYSSINPNEIIFNGQTRLNLLVS